MSLLRSKLWLWGLSVLLLALFQFQKDLLVFHSPRETTVVLAETKNEQGERTLGLATGSQVATRTAFPLKRNHSLHGARTPKTVKNSTASEASFRDSDNNNVTVDFLTVPLAPGAMNATAWRNKYSHRPYPYGGAFVHIGKTGGSTLSKLLRHGCHSFMEHPCVGFNVSDEEESIVSKYIETYYHIPDLPYLTYGEHSFYLVSVRDPLKRTISAFVYQHHLNRAVLEGGAGGISDKDRQAFQCFFTLESFARALGETPFIYNYPYHKTELVVENCTDFARAALDSKVKVQQVAHFFHNYGNLQDKLFRKAGKILVIRQEFLHIDWIRTNQLLSGSAKKVHGFSTNVSAVTQRNVTGMSLPVTRKLSPNGRALLCRALVKEYQAYVWLLKRAINLNDQDRKESILQSYKKCPEVEFLQREIEK